MKIAQSPDICVLGEVISLPCSVFTTIMDWFTKLWTDCNKY